MIGIYKIVNKITKRCYIGQSNNIERRFKEHILKSKNAKNSIGLAIKKYGIENFELVILEESDLFTREDLNELEIKYIEIYKPVYNRTLGGSGVKGLYKQKSVREKLRKAGKNQWKNMTLEQQQKQIKNNLKRPQIGHSVSQETREKLREHNLGKKQSKETIEKRKRSQQETWEKQGGKKGSGHFKRVRIVELNKEFKSVKDCSEFLGVTPNRISQVLKKAKHRNTIHKYHVEYVV